MSIPNNIKREHILEAISEIDRDGMRDGREGQRLLVLLFAGLPRQEPPR